MITVCYIHTYIHTYMLHTYTHTYMHTCIHAYIHTCIMKWRRAFNWPHISGRVLEEKYFTALDARANIYSITISPVHGVYYMEGFLGGIILNLERKILSALKTKNI